MSALGLHSICVAKYIPWNSSHWTAMHQADTQPASSAFVSAALAESHSSLTALSGNVLTGLLKFPLFTILNPTASVGTSPAAALPF